MEVSKLIGAVPELLLSKTKAQIGKDVNLPVDAKYLWF